jgi:hypothetical protein
VLVKEELMDAVTGLPGAVRPTGSSSLTPSPTAASYGPAPRRGHEARGPDTAGAAKLYLDSLKTPGAARHGDLARRDDDRRHSRPREARPAFLLIHAVEAATCARRSWGRENRVSGIGDRV